MIPLSRGLEFEVRGLPSTSRPEGVATPTEVPLTDWVVARDEDGVVEWRVPTQIVHVDFGHSTKKRPQGLQLKLAGMSLPYDRVADDEPLPVDKWSVREGLVRVRLAKEDGPPADAVLSYIGATSAEKRLNFNEADLETVEFITGSLQPGRDAMRGLYLPAPTEVVWQDLVVPKRGVVGFEATLFEAPWQTGVASDGAEVVLSIDGEEVKRLALEHGGHKRLLRFDVSKWAGQSVELSFRVDGGESDDLDYVFLEEPVVYTPKKDPTRVVLVFVDTLRADALGVYGASPEDSPNIDAWAEDALVFENARTVAPWTLPSARSALSGRQPERWDARDNLPARLAREGFLTRGSVANAFLDTPFGMGSAWSRYTYGFVAPATTQIDRALQALEAWPDRDLLLMVHFMEPHLPYREPEPYLSKWAPPQPEALDGRMNRTGIQGLSSSDQAEVEPYLRARYRQNVSYLDAELKRLLAFFDDDDLVVFYSDHGEEFWEHGEFEHGHSLHEEVLRIPLIVKGRGVPSQRRSNPVTLMDIVPTVLDVLGLEAEGLDGTSLIRAIPDRPQAFGHLLYGDDAWAVLDQGRKWIIGGGKERIYDLFHDPGELDAEVPTIEQSAAFAQTLAAALGRPVHPVWRVAQIGPNKHVSSPPEMRIMHPQGFLDAWTAYDPLDSLEPPVIDEGTVRMAVGKRRMPCEVYLRPNDVEDFEGLVVEIKRPREKAIQIAPDEDASAALDGRGKLLLNTGVGSRRVSVGATWAPEPVASTIDGVAPEREDELRVLGYLD